MAGDTPNDPPSQPGRPRTSRGPWRRPSERAATAAQTSAQGAEPTARKKSKKKSRARRIFDRVLEFLWLALKVFLVIVLLVCVIFFNRIVKSVYTGEMGVLWSRLGDGTVLDRTYTEGMYLIWPWDEFYIYDMREQELAQTTLVYAKDGLEISVTTSIRFRPTPSYLPRLHQDLGPTYVQKVIMPEVTSTVRKVLGNFNPEDIYAKDEQGLIDDLSQILRRDLNADFFHVTEFLVVELQLPDRIEQAIQRKLEAEQDMLAYKFLLAREKDEKERRIIEAEGLRAFETISGISILRWRAIDATEQIATSPNAKIILAGTGESQLPVLLSADLSSIDSPGPGKAPPKAPAPQRPVATPEQAAEMLDAATREAQEATTRALREAQRDGAPDGTPSPPGGGVTPPGSPVEPDQPAGDGQPGGR